MAKPSGRYVRQPEGYTPFVPNPLPPAHLVPSTEVTVRIVLDEGVLFRTNETVKALRALGPPRA